MSPPAMIPLVMPAPLLWGGAEGRTSPWGDAPAPSRERVVTREAAAGGAPGGLP